MVVDPGLSSGQHAGMLDRALLAPDRRFGNGSQRRIVPDHVKHAPLNGAWKPQSGEKLYFMVSSIAYIWNMNNYEGRTNVVEVIWP